MEESGSKLSRSEIVWGIVAAGLGFMVPLVLNQLLDSGFLHRFHKLLAYLTALVVLIVWMTLMQRRARRHPER